MDWNAQQTAEFRARTFKRLERIGLQGLENRIRYERLITPNDWQSQYRIFKGATFNLAHNLGQMLHLRPHNRFEDLQGVYLVGGGTHPGSGLPVIYESSRITCKEMAKDLGFPMKVMSPVANDSASVDEGFESTETLSSVQAV